MLNKDEERKIELLLTILKEELKEELVEEDPDKYVYEYKVKGLLWLAEKLKETNDELKGVYEEIALHARAHPEVYKNPKNEISDRFYPR